MRILLATPYYAPEWRFGGPPRKVSGLARMLKAKGHDPHVVTIHSERPKECERHLVDGIEVRYLPWIGSGRWPCPTKFRFLRDEIAEASVVHCFGLYNLICPSAAHFTCKLGKPLVIEPMGMFVPRMRSVLAKRIYNAVVTRWMFQRAATVIATSDAEADEIRSSASGANVVVRRNGIDMPGPSKGPAKSAFREARGIRHGERLIGYLGRISAKKQLLELVEAFSTGDLPQGKLLIAGPVSEPEYRSALLQAIGGSRRKDDIRLEEAFYGEEYDMALAALDLFVLPSANENFGNAAGEAAVAGVPVLLTKDCGIAPIIDGKFGVAVGQDIENLRRGLEQMLGNMARWKFDPVEAQQALSWDEPVRQMEEIYARASAEIRN